MMFLDFKLDSMYAQILIVKYKIYFKFWMWTTGLESELPV